MGPRIFISSTFYDLKYARETLSDFIEEHGFEPIRSETGDIGYVNGNNLDESCYKAVSESDMAVLIVGGRYGSPTSDSKEAEDKFSRYISVTHKEFDTAIKNNIPIFVFIDSAVYQEYKMYKKNKKEFEKKDCKIAFDAVDNINVHRFIENICLTPKIPICSFSNVSEIKNTLRKQWSDMMRTYLSSIKRNNSISQIEKSIDNVYSTVKQMSIMLDKVGELTINNEDVYTDVNQQQKIEYVAGRIANTFEFVSKLKTLDDIKNYINYLIESLYKAKNDNLLEYPFSKNFEDVAKFYSLFNTDQVLLSVVKEHLSFEENFFVEDDLFKERLAERLLKADCLEKMNLNI